MSWFSECARVLWAKGGERLVLEGDVVSIGQVLARTGDEESGYLDAVAPFSGVVAAAGDGFAVIRREGVFPPKVGHD